MDIAKAFRLAIAVSGKKHNVIAEAAGVDKQTISNVCNGRTIPSLTIVIKIAEALEIKVSELIALGE